MTIIRTRSDLAKITFDQLREIWGVKNRDLDQMTVAYYASCQRAGIPMEYLDLDWEDFQTTDAEALEKAKEFTANLSYHWRSKGGVLLLGPNGTGKSFLSYIIAKNAIQQGIATFCFSLVEYQRKKGIRSNPKLLNELLYMIENAQLVILDDYGKEYGKGNDWSSFENYMVVSEIFSGTKAVVMNTALLVKNLKEKAGSSILSRMVHFTNISMSGKDFREEGGVIDDATLKEMRTKKTKECWTAHSLLRTATIGNCKQCRYRFHPRLCCLRYNKRWKK